MIGGLWLWRLARRLVDVFRLRAFRDRRRAAGEEVPRSSAAPADGGTTEVTGNTTEPKVRYAAVQVGPVFRRRMYVPTFSALQRRPLLDLSAVRVLRSEVFEVLGVMWTVPPSVAPRLGIVLSFEEWAMRRHTVLMALRSITARGTEVQVFYVQQRTQAAAWLETGEVTHNLPAVIATLSRSRREMIWPIVIESVAQLLRSERVGAELAQWLTSLARVARVRGAAEQAVTLAGEALSHLPAAASVARCAALRCLGTALWDLGQTVGAQVALDQAAAVAVAVDRPRLAASVLCQLGLNALDTQEYRVAELRFRAAVDLLDPSTPARLRLRAHRGLAVALIEQGDAGAERHARIAFALHADSTSEDAVLDRQLVDVATVN